MVYFVLYERLCYKDSSVSKHFVLIFIECFFSHNNKYVHLTASLTWSYHWRNNWGYCHTQCRCFWAGRWHSKQQQQKDRNWKKDGIATWWKQEKREGEREIIDCTWEEIWTDTLQKMIHRWKKKKPHQKMLTIFSHQGNANIDQNELLLCIHRMA